MVGFQAVMGLALGLFAAAAPAGRPERTVSEIPYVTCDGSRWRVRLESEVFIHTPEAGGPSHDNIMRYRTWGGACWQASWNPYRREFFHVPVGAGQSHRDAILNFEDWDGQRWTARREGGDWVVIQP
ncbi:hypothetical protein [Brevundimonas sp. NIBR11]|uniref:hypothetical protein n=1 Tax=Brevundimonas sp. NIBR11 TaxID=3015999 RepID=UPI0022EFF725|nr:hypothetical protein [Brevundimonas sp. NIBR11]WGM32089.1 hypothetical protein KKHFBJBL_02340 [Brevundimonas sp. NIBR11]